MAEEAMTYDQLDALVGGVLPGGVEPTGPVGELGTAVGTATQLAAGGYTRSGGKRVIVEGTVYPDGTSVQRKMTRGTVKLSSADMTSYNRVKRLARQLGVKPRAKVGRKKRR